MHIQYTGPIFNSSGYAKIKFFFTHLSKRGYAVKFNHIGNKDDLKFNGIEEIDKVKEVSKPYINVMSGIAPQLRRDENASYNIGYSMFEANTIPENWINFYNELDEIWVPSTFCAKTFNRKDLKCIVKVIPLGFDDKIFIPKTKQNNIFTFLAVGKWIDRKGWDLLINAYTSEFVGDNDVRLCIKTDEQSKSKEDLIKEYLTNDKTSFMPRIMVNNQRVSEATLPLFYQEADCFILPSRGEAFCLPALEAMALGVPVITSDFGGQTDFVNQDNGWLIPIRMLKHLSERLCKINSAYNNLWFAEPSVKDIRQIMRYVYQHKNEVTQKSKIAFEMAQKYTWDKVTNIVQNRLKEIEVALK